MHLKSSSCPSSTDTDNASPTSREDRSVDTLRSRLALHESKCLVFGQVGAEIDERCNPRIVDGLAQALHQKITCKAFGIFSGEAGCLSYAFGNGVR